MIWQQPICIYPAKLDVDLSVIESLVEALMRVFGPECSKLETIGNIKNSESELKEEFRPQIQDQIAGRWVLHQVRDV